MQRYRRKWRRLKFKQIFVQFRWCFLTTKWQWCSATQPLSCISPDFNMTQTITAHFTWRLIESCHSIILVNYRFKEKRSTNHVEPQLLHRFCSPHKLKWQINWLQLQKCATFNKIACWKLLTFQHIENVWRIQLWIIFRWSLTSRWMHYHNIRI